MDILRQKKLTKEEWNSIEKPVSKQEKRILELIRDGYENVNLRLNFTQTMFTFTKLDRTSEIEFYLYDKYFYPLIKKIITKYGSLGKKLLSFKTDSKKIKKLRSIEALRIQNIDSTIQENKSTIYEFTLIEFCEKICKCIEKNSKDYILELYTLVQWKKNTILVMNEVQRFVDMVVEVAKGKTTTFSIVSQGSKLIEKNKNLFKYEDLQLFKHQKDLFTHCRMPTDEEGESVPTNPKLVLYIAPTGTGKTLSPLGLANQYKVIFVCVARHIGLALAKSAISIEKKVAFAFGCTTADDIRLHYYAATDYTRNKRSGGIGKVDNSKGQNVEIMICDVQSYICAMYYMMSFSDESKIITYWDEPTISMDYETHPLHETIHRNWSENQIPNMVLSCATLPKENEIQEVLQDFRANFDNANVHVITSYDCRKSIPIVTRKGYNYLPHMQYKSFDKIKQVAEYCLENKTMLRYFDLQEIIKFIGFLHVYKPGESFDSDSDSDEDEELSKPVTIFRQKSISGQQASPGDVIPMRYKMSQYFTDISEVTMDSVKVYYLLLLKNIDGTHWEYIHYKMNEMSSKRFQVKEHHSIQRAFSLQDTTSSARGNPIEKINSESEIQSMKEQMYKEIQGVLLTTADAHTLTDGPTIYLVEDVNKLAEFYIKNSDISEKLLNNIMEKIDKNQKLSEKIDEMEREVEEQLKKADNTDKTQEDQPKKGIGKVRVKDIKSDSAEALQFNINQLQFQIEGINLESEYIPNSAEHQEKWSPGHKNTAFIPRIESSTVKKIMALNIEPAFKILTLMGVGVLIKQENTNYEEIVKRLAQEQHLIIILTTSDYIYGTNYQFCHGFIGNDLQNMTQQKTLQTMGRIGRNNIQQEYTIRFRDDVMIEKLFEYPDENMEANNMNRLFCH